MPKHNLPVWQASYSVSAHNPGGIHHFAFWIDNGAFLDAFIGNFASFLSGLQVELEKSVVAS